MVSAPWVPFDGFLLKHFFCRLFHFVMTALFYCTEIPSLVPPDCSIDTVALGVLHGHCPYEVSIAVFTQRAYSRLSFFIPIKDAFPPVGLRSTMIRCQDSVRVIGVSVDVR